MPGATIALYRVAGSKKKEEGPFLDSERLEEHRRAMVTVTATGRVTAYGVQVADQLRQSRTVPGTTAAGQQQGSSTVAQYGLVLVRYISLYYLVVVAWEGGAGGGVVWVVYSGAGRCWGNLGEGSHRIGSLRRSACMCCTLPHITADYLVLDVASPIDYVPYVCSICIMPAGRCGPRRRACETRLTAT